MGISKGAKLAIRGLDLDGKDRVAKGMDISRSTLYRWLDTDDDGLTMAKSIKIIGEETGLPASAILEDQERATV